MNTSIIKFVGIGSEGCQAVECIMKNKSENVSFALCNTEEQVSVQNLLGDEPRILFLVAAFGMEEETNLLSEIANMACGLGVLTVGVVTIPFRSEKESSRSVAVSDIKAVMPHVDNLIIIDKEKLRQGQELTVDKVSDIADEALMKTIEGLMNIFDSKNDYLGFDVDDAIYTLRGGKMTVVGIGEGAGENKTELALANADKFIPLDGISLRQCSRIMLSSSCSESEAENMFEEVSSLKMRMLDEISVMWRLNVDESLGERVKVIALAATNDWNVDSITINC